MAVQLEHGSASDVGLMREVNADSHLANPRKKLFAVADGVGNMPGRKASQTALKKFARHFSRHADNLAAVKAAHRLVSGVNLRARKQPRERQGDLATTLTSLHFKNRSAQLAHVGDSRAYLFRQGTTTQLTIDHSDPVDKRIITHWLGMKEYEHDGQIYKFEPQTRTFKVQNKDVLLLCSDGLHKEVKDFVIHAVLMAASEGHITPQKAANTLIRLANNAGGSDNITAIVVRVKHI